jgi:hypothetical protein
VVFNFFLPFLVESGFIIQRIVDAGAESLGDEIQFNLFKHRPLEGGRGLNTI